MNLRKLSCAITLALASNAVLAAPSLFFLIDGNTFTQPFSISNQSSSSERVTRFQLELAPTNTIFDTVDFGPPGNSTSGVAFTPRSGTEVTTGLVMPATVADGASLLDISFTGFDAGETFLFDIDVDGASGSPITVTGDLLIGALATVDFSDGQRLLGVLSAVPGNADASQFVVTGITATPALPEPGTMALISSALLAWGLSRRVVRRS